MSNEMSSEQPVEESVAADPNATAPDESQEIAAGTGAGAGDVSGEGEESPVGDTEDPVAEEAVAEEAVAEEAVAEEAVAEEAVAEEAVAEEAVAEEAVAEEAVAEEAVAEEAAEAPAKPARKGPIEEIVEEEDTSIPDMNWYILKVQVNREDSIRDALLRRVKIEGLDEYFDEVVVPVEEVVEFTKTGKRRKVKRKLYPGYILARMAINDDSWFLVRETPGIGDFTGSAGKPTPMEQSEVDKILGRDKPEDEGEEPKGEVVNIPFKVDEQVRIKDGNFQNFEGKVENVDLTSGRVTVGISIFGRTTSVEFEHWQIEQL